MLTVIKNKLSDGGQVIYDYLVPRFFKDFLKNSLSDQSKDRLRKLLGAGRKQARMRKVNQAKYRLKNLGYQQSGYQEMLALFEQTTDPLLAEIAGFELALWHSDQYSDEDARKSLEILSQLRKEKITTEQKRRRAILTAENYDQLGRVDEAKTVLNQAIKEHAHPDLYLSYANLVDSVEDRLGWINKALLSYKIKEVYLDDKANLSYYDQLKTDQLESDTQQGQAKITVIIPVYNAGDQVRTAIDSILAQTWTNLEVLVVDDCSNDDTVEIVKSYLDKDSRVKFFQTPKNSGPYVARNIALQHATGDFVTINDADDWSHPEKLARQAKHLLTNPKVMGNTSEQARATEELTFYRRGKPGQYIFSNMSSFMFRRKQVLDKLGNWDSVRFAADSEFILRIKRIFGAKSVVELPIGPLSFQRQSADSLTGNSVFGFPGYFMGVRKEYRESQIYHHQTAKDLYYNYPQDKRPFQAPNPMLPEREVGKGESRLFDLIYCADFRETNPDLGVLYDELSYLIDPKLKLGVVQINQYELIPDQPISSTIRKLLNEHQVDVVCYGEKAKTAKIILRTPEALKHEQVYLPEIYADEVEIVPESELDPTRKTNLASFIKCK